MIESFQYLKMRISFRTGLLIILGSLNHNNIDDSKSEILLISTYIGKSLLVCTNTNIATTLHNFIKILRTEIYRYSSNPRYNQAISATAATILIAIIH